MILFSILLKKIVIELPPSRLTILSKLSPLKTHLGTLAHGREICAVKLKIRDSTHYTSQYNAHSRIYRDDKTLDGVGTFQTYNLRLKSVITCTTSSCI